MNYSSQPFSRLSYEFDEASQFQNNSLSGETNNGWCSCANTHDIRGKLNISSMHERLKRHRIPYRNHCVQLFIFRSVSSLMCNGTGGKALFMLNSHYSWFCASGGSPRPRDIGTGCAHHRRIEPNRSKDEL